MLLTVGAYWVGRHNAGIGGVPPAPTSVQASLGTEAIRQRVVLAALGEHFDRTERTLVELVNSEPGRRVDISAEQAWARDLLEANRLYRQAAGMQSPALAQVLEDLEPVLLEIANSPSQLTSDEFESLRGRIEARSLVFKVRVTGADVRARAAGPHSSRRVAVMTSILVAAMLAATAPAAGRVGEPSAVVLAEDPQAVEQTIYARGTAALDRGEFDAAAKAFAEVAALKGERADGALYWSAYAQNKRGRRDDALQAIASLKSGYPKSRWLRDARALEAEIRQASGQATVPERNGDEDLKLMALGGLMNADPDRALPLVEQLLATSQSDKVRDRALFVLAQSGSPKAREVLVRIARTGPDEDTQTRAIRYLGLFGGPESRQALVEIYKSSQNAAARKAVLHGSWSPATARVCSTSRAPRPRPSSSAKRFT